MLENVLVAVSSIANMRQKLIKFSIAPLVEKRVCGFRGEIDPVSFRPKFNCKFAEVGMIAFGHRFDKVRQIVDIPASLESLAPEFDRGEPGLNFCDDGFETGGRLFS